MTYQVLARKWRPKNFQQLVGQTHVSQALSYALDQGRLHHAYLFTGTRGVGKTTIARILAKSLNCEQNSISSQPCGQCATCREIDEGRYPDLLEIDAASRTGVDETRELMESVPYAPMKGRFKVYLIDEVHMFSKSSFNALLKTLEEPPEHVKFILATTDPQKLPITILSRCLHFHLKHLSESEISRHLAMVLQQENITFEADALAQIARAGAGSMRDSLSLLDQSIAFGQGIVLAKNVAHLLGMIPSSHLYAILKALTTQNGKALRAQLLAVERLAPDYGHLVFQLLEMLQQITMVQLDVLEEQDTIAQPLRLLALHLPVELVQLWYQILSDTWQSLPYQPSAKLCVEMGLLRMLAFQPLYPQHDVQRVSVVAEADHHALPAELLPETAPELESALPEVSTEPEPHALSEPMMVVEPMEEPVVSTVMMSEAPVMPEPESALPEVSTKPQSALPVVDDVSTQERGAMGCPDGEGGSSLPSNMILPEEKDVTQQGIVDEALRACVHDVQAWNHYLQQWIVHKTMPADLQSLLENSLPRAYEAGELTLAVQPESVMMWSVEREKALCALLSLRALHWVQEAQLYTPAVLQQQQEAQQRQQKQSAFLNNPHVQSALESLEARVEHIFD